LIRSRAVGGADFNGDPGPQAQNFESIDLNTTDPDRVHFDPQSIASFNAAHDHSHPWIFARLVSVENNFDGHPRRTLVRLRQPV
jgi:hypothetical protein